MENLRVFVIFFGGLVGTLLWASFDKAENSQEVNVSDTVYVENTVYVDTGNIYNEAIEHLKEYEGFRSHVYIDTDGSRTIGYGHHLKAGENFNSITEIEATEILIEDLDRRINYVNEQVDTLNSNQSLALGLFAFNCGTGNLDKALSNGLLSNINRITEYCHYKTTKDGEVVTKRSKKLRERREFELYIFNK